MTDPIEVMAKELEVWALSYRRSGYGRVAREQLAALAAAGFKVLPREPSGGMIHAGAEAIYGPRVGETITVTAAHKHAEVVWRSMWKTA